MYNDLETLKQRHQELDKSIKAGYSNYLDDANMAKMKHEKLMIKRLIKNLSEHETP